MRKPAIRIGIQAGRADLTPAGTRSACLALFAAVAIVLAPGHACAQKGVDDSYKGPSTGGGLDGQFRQQQGYEPAPQGGSEQAPRAGGSQGGGLRGTQRQGTIAPIPIAIPSFLGDDPKLAADVAEVVAADLQRSGLFQPLDPASFLE